MRDASTKKHIVNRFIYVICETANSPIYGPQDPLTIKVMNTIKIASDRRVNVYDNKTHVLINQYRYRWLEISIDFIFIFYIYITISIILNGKITYNKTFNAVSTFWNENFRKHLMCLKIILISTFRQYLKRIGMVILSGCWSANQVIHVCISVNVHILIIRINRIYKIK